ncbi:MAG: nitrile hydratase subunit beta [Paracoccaceae bacterium]
MDGIHDLGGKQGFGPIPIGDNVCFHHDWERRMWAIARSDVLPPGCTIDWFRHSIETMAPGNYLTLAYFNKWCTTHLMLALDAELITLDEIAAGHMDTPAEPAPALTLDQVIAAGRKQTRDFSCETMTPARFGLNDTVTTRRHINANHTRLPAYARNATGTVIRHHGAHLLADKGAQGLHEAEHLYTVSFGAPELWGKDANPIDTVTLELWESYFV